MRQTSYAEALLIKLRSQAAILQSESQVQVQTLDLIERDFLEVRNRAGCLERKRVLVETMLAQVCLRVKQELIKGKLLIF